MIDLCFDDENVEFYKIIAQIALELGSIALTVTLFFSLQYISLKHIFFSYCCTNLLISSPFYNLRNGRKPNFGL
jgi:hypothetical protein